VATVNISGILVVAPVDHIDAVIDALEALPGVDVHHIDRSGGRIVVTQEAPTVHDEVEGLKRIKVVPHVVLAEMVHHYIADDDEVVAAIPPGLDDAQLPRIPSFLSDETENPRNEPDHREECDDDHDAP
jgi:nitrate reductase NapD